MFRGDFEFHDGAAASHLGRSSAAKIAPQNLQEVVVPAAAMATEAANADGAVATWAPEAEKELSKIPFFVRGKARRNTERYAKDLGVPTITIETLYDAKAHFGR